jgi:hypothetical protein
MNKKENVNARTCAQDMFIRMNNAEVLQGSTPLHIILHIFDMTDGARAGRWKRGRQAHA